MKNKLFIISLVTIVLILLFFAVTSVFAHPGRTDSAGGHHDYNNISGLGEYHYHHGYSAHLHKNGICPYTIQDSTNNTHSTSSDSGNAVILKDKNIDTSIAKITEDDESSFLSNDIILALLSISAVLFGPYLIACTTKKIKNAIQKLHQHKNNLS